MNTLRTRSSVRSSKRSSDPIVSLFMRFGIAGAIMWVLEGVVGLSAVAGLLMIILNAVNDAGFATSSIITAFVIAGAAFVVAIPLVFYVLFSFFRTARKMF